jgi:polyphenol oxidase
MALPNPPVLADEKEGHVRLDVRRVNAIQLEQLGLGAEQIAIAPHCTFQDPERFFSYRRDGLKQVQWSGIVSVSA